MTAFAGFECATLFGKPFFEFFGRHNIIIKHLCLKVNICVVFIPLSSFVLFDFPNFGLSAKFEVKESE